MPSRMFPCPYDTVASATTRFAVEAVAWVAGPWAVASVTGLGWKAALPAAAVLIGIPAVFSTPGDKNQVMVPTPGRARLMFVEAPLHAVALAAPAFVAAAASSPVGVPLAMSTALVATSVGAGWERTKWLWEGAPMSSARGDSTRSAATNTSGDSDD